ncbi:uncharacterized protein BO72DRAFT_502200 [Aspergillus fijiensis CBS 313.89]|uniref:Uncharacterized protein n=1 Tax=Aspergillus fijiensis CBS 313.89 TaxID=1448319 RepID=A0A8G1RIQ7_9EURO|nr:uncharacterized protein BO72DRAFT_502200 [Aspergillus fijiensis CBS 313.89]RAK71166.1 hypothetical protein BO72DRAFT_502200 [Aspergillus fijiensis CBS 313.89]
MGKRKADTSGEADNANEMFDIAIDDAQPNNRKRAFGSDGATNAKRQKKNEKYGFGGKKRHSKSGDAVSSGDMRDFSVRKMKGGSRGGGGGGGGGGAKRPGKSRRAAAKGRA